MDTPSEIVEIPRATPPQLLTLGALFPVNPTGPVEVDIGCGKGRFLLNQAAQRPATNFIGLDRQLGRLAKVERKFRRQGLSNIRLFHAEAAPFVELALPRSSVQAFYVFFSDPWPKRRHHRRRLFNAAFVAAVHGALVTHGSLFVATDHGDYFKVIQDLVLRSALFAPVPPYEPREEEVTEFELVFRRQQAQIHRAGFRKA
jgi:tRNA (guanine-N7-)-methyltransferase